MKDHGPWKICSSREVYRDPWFRLQIDDVIRPDGQPGTFGLLDIKPGVCMVAIDDDGFVHLTEEFRYAIGRPSLEGVSGGVDEGEVPLDAARRALREELGIDAGLWTNLGTIDPYTSMVRSPVQLFIARNLKVGKPEREGTEHIRPVTLPLADAREAVEDGRITHAPTCLILARMERALRDSGTAGPRKPQVVVIEDNVDSADSMRILLELLGCEVAVAHTGTQGVALARSVRPDIVFCDIGLPGLSGYEVASKLRADSGGHRVVLVAVTAYGTEEDRRRAEAAGFDMHFVKPADPNGIAQLVKDCGLRSSATTTA